MKVMDSKIQIGPIILGIKASVRRKKRGKMKVMDSKIPIGLIILSIAAILMDCYVGYAFFLMLAMSPAVYLSPILFLAISLFLLLLFISSIIGLFRLKRWAYNTFVMLTLVFNSLSLLMDMEYFIRSGYITLQTPQVFLIAFIVIFLFYFLKPSTSSLFGKKEECGIRNPISHLAGACKGIKQARQRRLPV